MVIQALTTASAIKPLIRSEETPPHFCAAFYKTDGLGKHRLARCYCIACFYKPTVESVRPVLWASIILGGLFKVVHKGEIRSLLLFVDIYNDAPLKMELGSRKLESELHMCPWPSSYISHIRKLHTNQWFLKQKGHFLLMNWAYVLKSKESQTQAQTQILTHHSAGPNSNNKFLSQYHSCAEGS